ncbi:2-octaprenyl-6-methoxyphenyl hydroxylase [Acerihabitans arboris]|uniref:2-octaprenyl-6-methoxyphenyl hydroxylase n=1 Tax=Acerihabitans arboris TaxID=2691583 RepID=A0A845SMH0_9GAMM|nr:2-octaprenyl-6-methoxyphenyl hydroxylase [Acerihabitans arboris]NDL64166.1 2-octaprenyl-6-methoxyphenyl hydroxylase [Acerihabitans arboris]
MSVIIIGGGMAGATLALALSHMTGGRLDIDLVEAAAPESRRHPGYDARAIALAQGTCRQLTAIGVWPSLMSCATPIARVEVSDRGHAGKVRLEARDYRVPALGYVVELHDAGQRLFALLRQAPGVRLHCPAMLRDITRRQDDIQVTLDNGARLAGSLLVAADGSHSLAARHCDIQWRQEDYGQMAIIANVTTAIAHQGRAYERFTEHGPLAMLPMSQGRSSLVWCLPQSRRHEITDWSDARFIDALQTAFGWQLGRITACGQRHGYSLQLRTATRHISHRLALVGNAAQTLHPIAGQGFNLGLRDVMTLAEILAAALARGEDPGAYATLQRYQRRRLPDQAGTVGITDGLIHLFANRHLPLVVARNLGLATMASSSVLRDALARQTLGWVIR